MKLEGEKISVTGLFRVGFDKHSNKYLLETEDTFGGNRYFIITEEQYQWFDTEPDKLDQLNKDCVKKNCKSNIFYFSNWEMENSNEQNKLMWEYMYIDMLVGKKLNEIHKKIGIPNRILDDGNIEIFIMSYDLEIQVVYNGKLCTDVVVNWKV